MELRVDDELFGTWRRVTDLPGAGVFAPTGTVCAIGKLSAVDEEETSGSFAGTEVVTAAGATGIEIAGGGVVGLIGVV